MMRRRGTMSHGRRKIEIKKIQSEDARHVCFSKRKAGIFAKASDISTLCGADVALLVYSPAGNPYSFGSPSVQPIVDRFLSGNFGQAGSAANANPNNVVQQLNHQYMDLSKKLDAAKEKKAKLRERLDASVLSEEWAWANSIDNLGLEQLDRLKDGFEWLKGSAEARIKDILNSGQRMAPPPAPMRGGPVGMAPGAGGASSSSYPMWGFGPVQMAPNQLEPGSFQAQLAASNGMGNMGYMHHRMDGF
ncbi:hypothetical protein Cni_G08297 [Canna indica]|uniref:MADS-box domain-containing protein n=1 Tax=Canna indica TaxID=4628 RepID=A0AAQ3Q5L7_9LILI|nr:hypothetical protein Cni_G08297 [Canna indica]